QHSLSAYELPLSSYAFVLYAVPRPPRPTLFPYTTLFRSSNVPNVLRYAVPAYAFIAFRIRLTFTLHSSYSFSGIELMVIAPPTEDRKSTRLNSSHVKSSYAVFCLKNKIDNGGISDVVDTV